ncbi:hypothetical protein FSP39_024899 [Pinctada imbricata]|uniref:BTB domain-containing protein n=1 Tax=Pinctada imbricata TaxID=66713 RepID=A0AA88YGI3_PINIB|nr:hypothetical protein FSP39_024899 [Pinctada imbricata]
MPTVQEYECGPKCRSKRHALELNACITKGSLEEVQAYSRLCHNAGQICDEFGRTALHIASACGKYDIVEWLILDKNNDLSAKDKESGWTALHRAVFYGQLETARFLIQCNSDIYVQDNEGLTPLDLFMLERPHHVSFSDTDQNEVFSWGDNTNFTLGHSTELGKSFPEAVEAFRKSSISVRNVPNLVSALSTQDCTAIAASRDHSVFLLNDGTVYTCGLNDCHQLGQFPTPEKSLLPKLVNHKAFKGMSFKGVCAGRFHTVLYTKHQVYTFGLNAGQLGKLSSSMLHGIPKDQRKQTQPRLVTNLSLKDTTIDECNSALMLLLFVSPLTEKSTFYMSISVAELHLGMEASIIMVHVFSLENDNFCCLKIASVSVDIQKLCVVGGNLDHSQDLEVLREKGGYELIIAVLTKNGKIFMWKESVPQLKRCSWSVKRQLVVTDFALSSTLTAVTLAFITNRGEGFIGQTSLKSNQQIRKEDSQISKQEQASFDIRLLDLLLKDEAESFVTRRIPGVHRGSGVYSDVKGRNFTVLQSVANECMTDVPSVSQSEMMRDFQQLLEEADEFDLIHDVIIQVEEHTWPAHLFILLSRSDYFHKLVADAKKSCKGEKPIVQISDINPDIFYQLLYYIYTDTCDLIKVGSKFEFSHCRNSNSNFSEDEFHDWSHMKSRSAYEVTQSQKKSEKKGKGKKGGKAENNPVEMLKEAARKFGIKSLARKLDTVKFVNGRVEATNKVMQKTVLKFDRYKFKDLHDVSIASTDNVIIQCHKCVLVARLEYFHSMLASGWMETSNSQSLSLPVPGDILEVLIGYLYTDDASKVLESGNAELLCNVLVVADQMLVTRLKEMCETAITCLITLKNVGELLEFSSVYNAEQLHAACQQYIHINMAALMESRLLDVLSEEVMASLTSYYREKVPGMCRRQITPYAEGPSRDFIQSLVSDGSKPESVATEGSSKKSKSKKKRNRQKSVCEDGEKVSEGRRRTERQVSVSSVTSLVSDDGEEETFTPGAPQTLQKESSSKPIGIPGFERCAETISEDSILASPPTPSWGWVGPASPSSPALPVTTPTSPTAGSVDLRQIMREEDKKQAQSSQKKMPKNVKFSWKDVKKQQQLQQKQQQQQSITIDKSPDHGDKDHTSPKSACPWGQVKQESSVTSLRDVMSADKLKKETAIPFEKISTQESKGKSQIVSWGLPTSRVKGTKKGASTGASSTEELQSPPTSRSQENPWKVIAPVKSPVDSSVSFTDIVEDELQKHETFTRTTTKPLHLIQIEERAIQELLQHYNAEENNDEVITVERVPQAMAAPVWAAKQQTKQIVREG